MITPIQSGWTIQPITHRVSFLHWRSLRFSAQEWCSHLVSGINGGWSKTEYVNVNLRKNTFTHRWVQGWLVLGLSKGSDWGLQGGDGNGWHLRLNGWLGKTSTVRLKVSLPISLKSWELPRYPPPPQSQVFHYGSFSGADRLLSEKSLVL